MMNSLVFSTVRGVFVAYLVCCVVFELSVSADVSCSDPGWKTHQASLVQVSATSAINSTNLPLINQSLYGIEGGHIIWVEKKWLYIAIAEFTNPPHFVPSKIALWRAEFTASDDWSKHWQRLRTLYQIGCVEDCKSLCASLGSSVAFAFNEESNRYEIFYVGFKSCNDSHFENQYGRIFRSVSATEGNTQAGIEGQYSDVGVVLQPDPKKQQPWKVYCY